MLDPKPDRFQRLLTVYTQLVPNSLNFWLDNLLLSLFLGRELTECVRYCSPFGNHLPAVMVVKGQRELIVVKGQREFHLFSVCQVESKL